MDRILVLPPNLVFLWLWSFFDLEIDFLFLCGSFFFLLFASSAFFLVGAYFLPPIFAGGMGAYFLPPVFRLALSRFVTLSTLSPFCGDLRLFGT